MAYNKWYISGDVHGDFSRFEALENKDEINVAVIILGDAGINWFLNGKDIENKKKLVKKYPGITWYLLRGNHDARPEDVETMLVDYDDEIDGYVYYEPDFINIRYFMDGGEYMIDGHSVLTIGGAYSVDKYYRLAMKWTWFANEQLTLKEKLAIEEKVKGKKYDIVLTHTCPYDWRPTDLFLPMVDQSKVDTSTEKWLNDLKDTFTWRLWLFGHYHANRIERPYVEQFFTSVEYLDDVWNRWHGKSLPDLPWWLPTSPKFYIDK